MKDLEETVSAVPTNAMGASSPSTSGPIAMPERLLFKKKKRNKEPKKLRAILGEAKIPARDIKSAEKEGSYPRASNYSVGPYAAMASRREQEVKSLAPKKRDEMFMDHISSGKTDPMMSTLAAKHGSPAVHRALVQREVDRAPEDRNAQVLRSVHHYGGEGVRKMIAKHGLLGEEQDRFDFVGKGKPDPINTTLSMNPKSDKVEPPKPSAVKPKATPKPGPEKFIPKSPEDALKYDEVQKLGRQPREILNYEFDKNKGGK